MGGDNRKVAPKLLHIDAIIIIDILMMNSILILDQNIDHNKHSLHHVSKIKNYHQC